MPGVHWVVMVLLFPWGASCVSDTGDGWVCLCVSSSAILLLFHSGLGGGHAAVSRLSTSLADLWDLTRFDQQMYRASRDRRYSMATWVILSEDVLKLGAEVSLCCVSECTLVRRKRARGRQWACHDREKKPVTPCTAASWSSPCQMKQRDCVAERTGRWPRTSSGSSPVSVGFERRHSEMLLASRAS
ncbi:hypothetical protein EV126DRAFT_250398 [Verticillium dahliae]|nr:hypothetical protein EV126DRAFT_250398 [Verticillium dahliae]